MTKLLNLRAFNECVDSYRYDCVKQLKLGSIKV